MVTPGPGTALNQFALMLTIWIRAASAVAGTAASTAPMNMCRVFIFLPPPRDVLHRLKAINRPPLQINRLPVSLGPRVKKLDRPSLQRADDDSSDPAAGLSSLRSANVLVSASAQVPAQKLEGLRVERCHVL